MSNPDFPFPGPRHKLTGRAQRLINPTLWEVDCLSDGV